MTGLKNRSMPHTEKKKNKVSDNNRIGPTGHRFFEGSLALILAPTIKAKHFVEFVGGTCTIGGRAMGVRDSGKTMKNPKEDHQF